MKGLIIKMTMLVFIAVGMANYALYLLTGKTPMSDISLSMPDFSLDSPLSSGQTTLYKWTDDKGVVHFSEAPPLKQEQSSTTVIVDSSQMTTIEPPPDIPAFREGAQRSSAVGIDNMSVGTLLPTPGNIQKLVSDAKNTQNLVDERHQELQKAIGDL